MIRFWRISRYQCICICIQTSDVSNIFYLLVRHPSINCLVFDSWAAASPDYRHGLACIAKLSISPGEVTAYAATAYEAAAARIDCFHLVWCRECSRATNIGLAPCSEKRAGAAWMDGIV